jgi:hypothetical protein
LPKTLIVAASLFQAALVSNFVQTAKAQQSNPAREQVIRECNLHGEARLA